VNVPDEPKAADCARFKRVVFHFQADEIPEPERAPLEEHLVVCRCCADRLALEESMLAGLRARLGRGEPPPGLETRIRAALREGRVAGVVASWFRAPLAVAAIAASLLLAMLLLPLDGALGNPQRGAGVAFSGEVIVVDLDCHRAGKTLVQQRACRHDKHINALELPDGRVWNLSLAQALARDLALDRDLRGHRMAMTGEYFPRLDTLWVKSTADLGTQL